MNTPLLLLVLSVVPSGKTDSPRAAASVVATFNQPMVALASPADMGKECPLRLEPKVAGRCRWQGTQVLAFEPDAPLTPATRYKAIIPAGTKSAVSGLALKEAKTWEFETPRPRLVDSAPRHDEKWIALDASLFLHFTQVMDPKKARSFIELRETALDGSAARTVSVGVRRATEEEVKKVWPYHWGEFPPSTSTVVAVKPSALHPDRAYRLVLKEGLPSAEGPLGLSAEAAVDFETFYAFRALSGPVTRCLPRGYELELSNPTRLGDLLSNARIEGTTRTWSAEGRASESTGDRDGSRRVVSFGLPDPGFLPDGNYAIVLSSGLKDLFGQALGTEVRLPFSNSWYCPRLSMNGGFGVLEQYMPARIPVVAVNAERRPLQKAFIDDEAFIPFQRSQRGGCEKEEVAGEQKTWDVGLPRNRTLRTFIDLGPVFASHGAPGGFAFAQVQDPEGCWRKATVDVTRVGLTLKSSPDSTLVWASYLKTGAPAAGVPVQLRGDDNAVLWRGVTGKNGVADAPGWKGLGFKDWKRWTRPNVWAFAKDPKGTAALSLDWRGELDAWRFNISSDWQPRPDRFRGVVFTERGVYRGGETVRLKGVFRKLEKGDWAALGDGDPRALVLTVTDARGTKVYKSSVTLSANSSFDAAVPLPSEPANGWWSASVTEPGKEDEDLVRPVEEGEEGEDGHSYAGREERISASRGFRVEAFKPASFEVKAIPGAPSYLAGDSWTAGVEGWWLFGAPMAGEKASWTLRLEPASWTPPGWEGFDFSPGWHRRHAETGRLLASGEETLDAQGKARVQAKLDPGAGLGALSARFEASVTSPERQKLFARGSSMVHRADLYLGVKENKPFLETGEAWRVEAVAVRPDGTRVTSLPADWSVTRRDWLSVQRAGVAGRLEWVSEQRDVLVSSGAFPANAPSTWTWTFTPDKPGQYEFAASAKDEAGRPVETQLGFYAAGAGEAYWRRGDTDLIEIVADKQKYKPGETAKLMVKSPYKRATALVTVEREGVISRWTQELKGGADFVRVPLDDRAVPNVYVGIVALAGRSGGAKYSEDGDDLSKPQAKFGYAALSVDPGGRRVAVTLQSGRSDYRPGATVDATVTARDEAGRPVTGEATVYAVDEGVLNLTGYETPDLWREFYGERPLLVGSADSRQFVIGQRSFGEKGKNRGGGGGRGGLPPGVDLRSDFRPTAFWAPTVELGPDGRGSVSFKLPDTLTRFRLMAVVHAGRRFGGGESRFTSSKPLLLRPSLPRLARVGDEFDGGVVVHNYTKQDSTVTVTLALEGTAVSAKGDAKRTVFVPAGRAVEAVWKCRASFAGPSTFKFYAVAGAENDGLEWKLPVRATERLEHAATAGVTDGSAIELVARPTNASPGGALEVSMSPTALSGLREGARYLLEYPYGCLEQRLSRALPVVTGADLVETFGLGTVAAMKPAVQDVFDRLGDFQHGSGGYGYWPSPWMPDPWVTAYALESAALARREGYRLPEDSIRKALDWGGRYLSQDKADWAYPYSRSEDYAGRAYMTYALGLHSRPQSASFRRLFDRRDQLSLTAKAWLLKAASASGTEADAKTLADDLLAQSRVEPRGLHFELSELDDMPWLHESGVHTTAIALQALLEARGGFPGDEKAARWLVEERKALGRWRTTAENSAGLRALQDFYRRYEKDEPAFTATLKRDGDASALWTESFQGRTTVARRKSLPLDAVLGGAAQSRLALVKDGIGRLYYDLVLSYAPASFDAPAREGFELEREVKSLKGDLTAGKRAVVTLTVRTKQDRLFVALEDPLPAGWEIVDPTFAVEGREDERALEEQSARGHYWGSFQRSEKYDDRIQVFADYMTAGEHKWSYLIQATTPGKFHQPAAVVEEMYKPEVFGRTASSTQEIVR